MLTRLIFVVLCFFCYFLRCDERKQILKNGDFELVNEESISAGWSSIPKNAVCLVESQNSKYVCLSNKDASKSARLTYKEQIVLPKDTDSVLVKGKVNIKEIIPGKESWHDARIALTFKDKKGKVVEHAACFWKKPTNGWDDFQKRFVVKESAYSLSLSIALFQCPGEIEFDDMELWTIQNPKDEISWTLDDAYQTSTLTRNKVSLNGVWKIKLFPEIMSGAKENYLTAKGLEKINNLENYKWTILRTPGEWYSSHWSYYTRRECLLPIKGDQGPRPGICSEKTWQGRPLKDYFCGWYEREFTMPETWKNGNTFLRFDDISLAGKIYVNSKWVADQLGNDAKNIPLSQDIKPGDKVVLNVLTTAEVNGIEKLVMGGGENYIIKRKKESYSRGIIGNVWLLKLPKLQIENLMISPSVRRKCLDISFSLNKPQGTSKLKAEVEVLRNDNSKLEKEYSSDLKYDPESKKFSFSMPWDNATLWTPDNPFMYKLTLKVKDSSGCVLDEYEPVRFGFREFWIDKGNYYLNGNIAHLRSFTISSSPKKYCKELFRKQKGVGYNTVYIHPVLQTKPIMDAADEEGMLVVMCLPSVHDFLKNWKSEGKALWIKKIIPYIRDLGNHPSLIHWSMSRNMLGYPFDMLPQLIGIEDSRNFGPTGKIVLESQKIVNSIDGSRPILHHACGSIGNVHSSNIYLDFVQPQEKKEWLLEYKNKRVKPFYAVELGMPYANTYYYGRKGFGEVLKTEPLHCEYAAMELGESAYKKAGKGILRKIAEAKVKRGDNSTPDKYNPRINIHSTDAYLESQASLLDFLKYWRACEAGGLHPWATKLWDSQSWGWKEAKYENLKTPGIKTRFEYQPRFGKANVLHDIFKKNFSPLLLFIGGRKETFTDNRKNYFAGDQIDKSVVLVNDKHSDITLPLKISLIGKKGNQIESKKLQVELSPGQTKIYDFSFIAPNCLKKEELTIEAISTEPGNAVNDSFKLQIFPRALKDIALAHKRSVFLLDPKGDSAKLLKSIGIKFLEYKGNLLGDNDLLIIGRFSLPSAKDYSENIKASLLHGANLLVFEQKKNDLRKYLGLRSFKASSRKVFTGYGSSDILPEISSNDLINWAGKATALPEFPEPGSNSYPEHIWKQGNTGIVSSVTIEKPHCGPFVAILHEGYNLNYTPLLLEFIEKGKALYCQLDLTSRTKKEPVTMLILKNIFNYLDIPSENMTRHVAYSGDASGEKILAWMGINFNKTDNANPGELWILGGDIKSLYAKLHEKIHAFLNNGGDIIILNASNLSEWANFLGASIKEYSMAGYTFDQKSLGSLTKGLTAADWYWKDNISMPIPEKDFPIKKINVGKGAVLFCQINPFYFDDKQMNQRRYASRIKMFKVLSQIFTAEKATYGFNSCDCMKGVPENNIDLSGPWKFRIDPENQGEKLNWHQTNWPENIPSINAPGCWEKQNIIQSNPNFPNSSMPYDGYAWYQKNISIGKDFKDQKIYIEIGAIDDCDWIYFNGKLIGRTGKETKGWYAARRYYQIPNGIINFDAANLISIKVFDDNREGGIVSGPVRIISKKIKEDFPYLEALETPRHDPYLFQRW